MARGLRGAWVAGDRSPGPALQRPDVEEQEQEGQRDPHRLGEEAEREEREDAGVAKGASASRVGRVDEEREQPEQRRQHVLPLRHPGDRFHVGGVHGEEGGDEGAAPGRAGHAPEHQEDEDRVPGVEHSVHEVVRPGREPEELHVEHVGEPGERVPVEGVQRGEGPGHPLPGEPGPHDRVLGHVLVVVEEQEREACHAGVQPEGEEEERRRDEPAGSHRGGAGHRRFCHVPSCTADLGSGGSRERGGPTTADPPTESNQGHGDFQSLPVYPRGSVPPVIPLR